MSSSSSNNNFYDNAARILSAADGVSEGGTRSVQYPGMVIWISPEGGIRVVPDCAAAPLEELQAQTGAQMIYRVSQQESKTRLEGRAGLRTCLFEAGEPNGAARTILLGTSGSSRGCYRLENAESKNNWRPAADASLQVPIPEPGQLIRTTA